RMFGDNYPKAVVDRGVQAWMQFIDAPDQIARILEAILIDGQEIGDLPPTKVRRPYERLIALFRKTNMVVNANRSMTTALDGVKDFLFSWPSPDGRPDKSGYWLTTGTMLATWNLLFQWPAIAEINTTLADQTPVGTGASATTVVEYWVGRIIGRQI